jgi:hypothetical protein
MQTTPVSALYSREVRELVHMNVMLSVDAIRRSRATATFGT